MIVAAVQGLMRSVVAANERLLGRPVFRATLDRRLLESRILPALARRVDITRLLFVGCASYTRHYEALFERTEYWTIDPSSRRQRWAAGHHIRDRLERLGLHVPRGYFDAIVCNGVLGWGLDRRADAETAFEACFDALRSRGELIVGWNDVPPHNRVVPGCVSALGRFVRADFDAFRASQIRIDVPHRHVFEFYRKPGVRAVDPWQEDGVVGAGAASAQADSGLHLPSIHHS